MTDATRDITIEDVLTVLRENVPQSTSETPVADTLIGLMTREMGTLDITKLIEQRTHGIQIAVLSTEAKVRNG